MKFIIIEGPDNCGKNTLIATDVEPLGEQHLDQGEDLEPRMFSREEVLDMLQKGEIWQALMAAPLWKYFAN